MTTMPNFSWEDLADALQDIAPSPAQGKMAVRGLSAIRRRSDLGEIDSRALLRQILAVIWLMQATPTDGSGDPLAMLTDIHKAMVAHDPSALPLALRMLDQNDSPTPKPSA